MAPERKTTRAQTVAAVTRDRLRDRKIPTKREEEKPARSECTTLHRTKSCIIYTNAVFSFDCMDRKYKCPTEAGTVSS